MHRIIQISKVIFKIVIFVFICLLLYPFIIGPFIVGPLVNETIARNTKNDLLSLSLPAETEVIDSMSVSGNIVSQGNKIQYLGLILIRSEQTLEELEEHYSQFMDLYLRVSERAYAFQHMRISYQTLAEVESYENHFVVLIWGNHYWRSSFFTGFDIRAH